MEEEEGEEIVKKINEKVDNIICEDEEIRENLREILMRNKSLFRESAGRMDAMCTSLK